MRDMRAAARFLIAGKGKPDVPAGLPALAQQSLGSRQKSSQMSLHIRRSAPIDIAAVHFTAKGRMRPGAQIAGADHIQVR